QLWPEPLAETIKSACNFDLPESFVINERSHSYSNWMHGVWYTENGTLTIEPSEATSMIVALNHDPEYILENAAFEKFVIGRVQTTCSVNESSGVINYDLALW
ncbi:MAG: hypothetical protein ACW7DS_17080, partial [Paraglaciecola chathamensis]